MHIKRQLFSGLATSYIKRVVRLCTATVTGVANRSYEQKGRRNVLEMPNTHVRFNGSFHRAAQGPVEGAEGMLGAPWWRGWWAHPSIWSEGVVAGRTEDRGRPVGTERGRAEGALMALADRRLPSRQPAAALVNGRQRQRREEETISTSSSRVTMLNTHIKKHTLTQSTHGLGQSPKADLSDNQKGK